MIFKKVAIIYVKENIYIIYIWGIRKGKAIDKKDNSDLILKSKLI